MGVHSRQPLAVGKGTLREVESEGSQRKSSAPRNTNHIRHNRWNENAKQVLKPLAKPPSPAITSATTKKNKPPMEKHVKFITLVEVTVWQQYL
ncbi:hypothetical protein [Thermophagus sp. OGC60D27]|uniref:hypothetical protein n=1 Tax=Thermophagus sp. OGC60D27 TaxID=3458415 RepID=UPI00403803E5